LSAINVFKVLTEISGRTACFGTGFSKGISVAGEHRMGGEISPRGIRIL
jgi:hypothetical protein